MCLSILLWAGPSSADGAPADGGSGDRADRSWVVYITRRAWHIDIGLAAADLTPPLDSVESDLPGAHYLFFGFGDRHYLLAKNHNPLEMLAALWPGGGLILATGVPGSPGDAFGAAHVISLRVGEERLLALRSFIWHSMVTNDGALNVYHIGPYEDSIYYLATAKYSAVHTCNTWAAQALRAAGFHVHSAGVVLAGQLWSQAKRLEREQTAEREHRASLLPSPGGD